MAELLAAGTALGVVSSLITIVDVAWRVLKRLDEYGDRTKDVPAAIKHIRPQLRVLADKTTARYQPTPTEHYPKPWERLRGR
jgi:hypothetical protein